MNALALRRAVVALVTGGVIAYPTETVWGLGCDPFSDEALSRLLAIKRRSWRKGLIVVAADLEQLRPFVAPDYWDALRGAQARVSAPTTWVVPAARQVSPLLSGGRGTIAVRVSAHPLVRELCESFGGAVVSTSANHSGRRTARSAIAVRCRFGAEVEVVLNGRLGESQRPSEIRELVTGRVLRAGGSTGVKT